jgi:hypothetical protein
MHWARIVKISDNMICQELFNTFGTGGVSIRRAIRLGLNIEIRDTCAQLQTVWKSRNIVVLQAGTPMLQTNNGIHE